MRTRVGTRRRTGDLTRRLASLFAGALPDGAWVVVHRLNADPDGTDELGITLLRQSRQSGQGGQN
ncbi:hypothetical protein OG352_12725 [Streptomyces sp. NBC_01485]|uniref:hypothetical protein n=1 Tax=Streptomyces sp. NBC_01485 TaxID=2903884 RepID=UPI002E3526B7|nr:hypothetical protein [Streptomyces sp. NBC_01485]